MEIKISLPIVLLKAAYLATTKMDNYPYPTFGTDYVSICDGHIFGTNRACMFYAEVPQIDKDIKINIPRKHVKYFLKKIKNFNLNVTSVCELKYNIETNEGLIHIPYYDCAYEGFLTFITKPINWKKAIPKNGISPEFNGNYPQFQGKYILLLEDIAKELGSICRPIIKPTSEHDVAIVDFKHSEIDFSVHALLMPFNTSTPKTKYCIVIYDEPDDAEPSHVGPAESAHIAIRAVKRLRANTAYGFQDPNFAGLERIVIRIWTGSEEEHLETMVYDEEWLKKPLCRFNTPEKAISYIETLGDCVECYKGDSSITAKTISDVNNFFTQLVESKDA